MTLYDTTYDSNFCDTRNLYQNLKIWYFGIFRRKEFFFAPQIIPDSSKIGLLLMVYDIGKLTLTSGRCPLSLACTGWIIFIKILKILHIMHLLFSSYPIIFRKTFTLEPIYFINSKPDLAFKFRCCEFGFIKQIRKLNNITLYHGIKREGKFKIIVFEPQTR